MDKKVSKIKTKIILLYSFENIKAIIDQTQLSVGLAEQLHSSYLSKGITSLLIGLCTFC